MANTDLSPRELKLLQLLRKLKLCLGILLFWFALIALVLNGRNPLLVVIGIALFQLFNLPFLIAVVGSFKVFMKSPRLRPSYLAFVAVATPLEFIQLYLAMKLIN